MLLETGDKLHVITRRQFEEDVRRHFVGEVAAATGDTVRVVGFTFVYNPGRGEFSKRPETRVRIFGLTDGVHIVNVIPRNVDLGAVRYAMSKERRLVVTDGKDFALDINEFGPIS